MPHAGEFVGGPSFQVGGSIRSRSPTLGVGFNNGAGGTVTQTVSKSDGVTLNKVCGRVTMHNASLAAARAVSFTLTNSVSQTGDVVVWSQRGGTDGAYALTFNPSNGSILVTLRNLTAGDLAEAFAFNFVIIKSVTA